MPHDDQAGPVLIFHDRMERVESHAEATHTEHGITYLMSGWIEIEHGQPVRAEGGTFTIVPAGVPHRILGGASAEFWLVGFCATCLGLHEGLPLMRAYRRVRHGALGVVTVPKGRRQRVLRLLGELAEENTRGSDESPELVRSLLLLLLGEVSRAMPGGGSALPEGSLVGDALAMIQRRCLEPISLRDVAASVHRTPTHVAAMVKKETGYSVGQWIAAGRVAEAAARLAHTDDSLDEIATHVGWRDKTHFIRQFKKAHGITPAAWRKVHRARHNEGSETQN